MKTIQCECGEFIEVVGITVCKNCHYIHHSNDKKEINYRFYCPDCNSGFNGLVPTCPICNEWVENNQKPIKKEYRQPYQPLKFNSRPVIHVTKPNNELKEKVENVELKVDPQDVKRKPTFLQNLILGMFCFDTGFTVGNAVKYAVIRKMMR